MTSPSTSITRILDAHGVAYRLLPHAQPVFTMEEAVRQRDVSIETTIKSILLRDKPGHFVMACTRGHERVRPQSVRAVMPDDWRRLTFANADEILQVTGFVQGSVAPLGLAQGIPVVFDRAITRHGVVSMSSGDPMAGLELELVDLIELAEPILADIVAK